MPIDPDYPEDRISYILDDSNTDLLLTQSYLIEKISFNGELVNLEDEKLYVGDGENLELSSLSDSLAEIIYTGSTGRKLW